MEEMLYKAIFDHIKSAVIIADSEGIIDTNIAFLKMFRLADKEALKKSSYYTNIVRKTISSGTSAREGIRDSEDNLLHLEIGVSKTTLGRELFILEFNPMDDQTLYHEVSIQAPHTRELFGNYPDPIVILDNQGRIIDANSKFEKVFGFSRTESIGRSIDSLIVPEEERNEAEKLFSRVLNQERVEVSLKRRTRSGELLDVLAVGYPVKIDQKESGNYVIYRDQSGEKKARRLLKEKEEFLEQLFNRSLFPIAILNEKEEVLDINTGFSALFGFSKEEITGKCINDFIVPEGYEEESEKLRTTVFQASSMNTRTKRKTRSGTLVDVEAVGSPVVINDRVVGMFAMYRDIRREEEILHDLRREKTFFQQLFDNTPSAVAMIDQEGRVRSINKPFKDLFGYTLQDFEKRSLNELIVPDGKKEESALLVKEVMDLQKQVQLETVRKTRKGELPEIQLIAFPVMLEGDKLGAYTIFQDISERKKREREIHTLLYADSLTELYNRKYAYESLSCMVEAVDPEIFSIVYIDLDKFKEVNDEKGHNAGDLLLKSFSQRMKENFGERMELCRIGGDEFLGLIRGADPGPYLPEIQNLFKVPVTLEGEPYTISMSIGTASFPEDGSTVDQLISKADERMYNDKKVKRILSNPVRTQIPVEKLIKKELDNDRKR
jgi:diguanylate cyclase (GGDEF)-like protein/PAS domain S-box-containing protein